MKCFYGHYFEIDSLTLIQLYKFDDSNINFLSDTEAE